MKTMKLLPGLVVFILLALRAGGTTYYVNMANPTPAAPFTNWPTAATNIQDAIDASTNGDLVLVTNGVYQFGGTVMAGDLTNRVALNKPITVQSVNGLWVTTIRGVGATNGTAAVRCAWLTNNASLIGFTITGGATRNSGDTVSLESGGGVWCASSNSLVGNCLIVSNTAYGYGGGVYSGTVSSSLISTNGSVFFTTGASYKSVLKNCTIISNAISGAVSPIAMTNCIIYYNSGGNYSVSGSAFSHCCTTPALSGTGNFTTAPKFFADGIHPATNSPCIGAGIGPVAGTDIFGNSWANPPSVGCAEWQPAPIIIPSQILPANSPAGFTIVTVAVGGQPPFTFSWLKEGVPLQDNGHYSSTQTNNLVANGVSLADVGNYQLVASNAFGVVTSTVVQLVIHCVNVAGTNPAAPYSTWATAATNIQDAINFASPGDMVLVTNGIYQSGGMVMFADLTNRVALIKPVIVQSVNGPWVTTIQGLGATNGAAAVRCAWLTNGAALVGFTLQGGATRTGGTGDANLYMSGGGAWCASTNATVSYCIIQSNTAVLNGSGAYQGTLKNCLLTGNTFASGGCSVNSAMVNCTVVGNSCTGVAGGTYSNCIVYFNSPSDHPSSGVTFTYCCTTSPTGIGNISAAPQLATDGVHLTPTSPCIGAGTNLVNGWDIFNQPLANPPSMGCVEWQPAPFVTQPQIQRTGTPVGFTVGNSFIAGQTPFTYSWLKDSALLQDNGHYSYTQTTNLVATGVSLADAGNYQLIVSNAFGVVTSAVAQLVVHGVNVAGTNPVAPYLTWGTAATNIQDAITASVAGDIVLVTNGVYATGGYVMFGDVTNRITLDKPMTVTSVNGYAATVIQGAWDPISKNGPSAVRCAFLTNGTVLSGFTLQNGATHALGSISTDGGGVCCHSSSNQVQSIVSNCVLSNNSAVYGGGFAGGGVLNNSLVINNQAYYGGGADWAALNNCTVVNNYTTSFVRNGAGIYACTVKNSIVVDNYDNFGIGLMDNYSTLYYYQFTDSCTWPSVSGTGNIYGDPQFLDSFHIASTSPCCGAGSNTYAAGTDLDGEPWNNPPSMGCDEVVLANLAGPLSVSVLAYQTNLLVNRYGSLAGTITGRASNVAWLFGDGPAVTNAGSVTAHQWTNSGDYTVTFTAYNNDNPAGVSANTVVHVVPLNVPQLQAAGLPTNGFQFQFAGQTNANYTIQYATNLISPVAWQTLRSITNSSVGVLLITDTNASNGARFYRVQAQ